MLEAGCLRLEPMGARPLSFLAYRLGFRPIALGDVIEEAPRARFLLSFDLAPQPNTSKQKIQLLDVLAQGARGRLCAKRFRVPVKDAPLVEDS